jgi:hypothetical protein
MSASGAAGGRRGTFWVLEDSPPATRPRWFCHWDGADAPGFESVEEAVACGLSRAVSVIVRNPFPCSRHIRSMRFRGELVGFGSVGCFAGELGGGRAHIL